MNKKINKKIWFYIFIIVWVIFYFNIFKVNSFYFNDKYRNSKNNIQQLLKEDLKLWINNCLNIEWPLFFNDKKNIQKYCYYQLLYFINKENFYIKKFFPYDEFAEMNFFWNNTYIKRINNKLLNIISKNNPFVWEIDSNELIKYNNVLIHKIIYDDLHFLNEEYKKVFKKNIYINSWYRSLSQQSVLYKRYIDLYWINQKIATKPWTSEHHLWTTIDIKKEFNQEGILNYDWLNDNAWKYWFIRTYNNYCIDEYWIINEDWHYRWVWKFLSTKWKIWEFENKNKCNINFLKF